MVTLQQRVSFAFSNDIEGLLAKRSPEKEGGFVKGEIEATTALTILPLTTYLDPSAAETKSSFVHRQNLLCLLKTYPRCEHGSAQRDRHRVEISTGTIGEIPGVG